ncbi:hypothetical protein ANTRET_LOCUS7184 [Anthophora retusa]
MHFKKFKRNIFSNTRQIVKLGRIRYTFTLVVLVLVLAVVHIYAIGEVLGDLMGQEFQQANIDYVREKRQVPNYHSQSVNQAPPEIQELLHAQNYRRPLVPIPSQPIPQLGPSQPPQPQQVSQGQVSQYQPRVTISSAAQQPDYRGVSTNAGQYKKPIYPQQQQYRPLPQGAQPNYNTPQQPQYSSKLPPHLQQLLQYQSSIANSIPRS